MAYNNTNNGNSPLNSRLKGDNSRGLDGYEAFALRENKSQKLRIVNAKEYSKTVQKLLDKNAEYQRLLDKETALSSAELLKHNVEYQRLLQKRANAADEAERNKIQASIESKEKEIRKQSLFELRKIGKEKLKIEQKVQELALNKSQFDFQERFSKMRRYEQQEYFNREKTELGFTISMLNDQIAAIKEKGELSKADSEELAALEETLNNQLEARKNLIQSQLKLQLQVSAEAIKTEQDTYDAEVEFENKFYDTKRKNIDELAEQEHQKRMQQLKQEHHDAVKFIKQEHTLRMQELEQESKYALDKDKIQHELHLAQEADTENVIKDNATLALNKAKLSDISRFSPEERVNMHKQNFDIMMSNRTRLGTAKNAENRAFKELAKSTGKSIKELRQDISKGVEFEDKDNDLVEIIKDAQSQQNILNGSSVKDILKEGILGGESVGNVVNSLVGSSMTKLLGGPLSSAVEALGAVAGKLNAKLNEYMDTYYQYQSKLMTRLNGSDHEYDAMQKLVRSQIGTSPYVTQTKVMEKIADLVEKGIAQNVEERALLAAIGDKLVTTFDADNASLMRLIRLQQKDTTALYMGMEGFLNKLLNQWFEDTSYLSDEFDNIESILLELDSTMNDSVGVNFAIQKWMAALSTMGMSGNTLQNLAEGLVALGTGDITKLSSNESLQSLFAIVSNNKNLHYGDMLTEGITEGNINTLMRGIVEYINDINTQNNNVVNAQYQQLFNMTRADFEAISNLAQSSKFGAVYNAYSTSAQSKMWLDDYVTTIGDRMHLSEKMDNLVENALTTLGTSISDNAVTYGLWRVNEFIGGLDLPVVSAAANLANSAVAIGAGIKNIAQITSALNKTFKITIKDWEDSDFETRSRGSYKAVPSVAASAPASASSPVTSSTSLSYAMSSRGGGSGNSNPASITSATSSYQSLNEQIKAVANYVDEDGNTLADYQSQINSITNSVSKGSLTEASAVAANAVTGVEMQEANDTLEKLYNDLFTKPIMVTPTTASGSSNTIVEINKVMNTNNAVNVTVTNETIKTQSSVETISDNVKAVITSAVLGALTKNDERPRSTVTDSVNKSAITLEDLIYKIVNGEVAVNISNTNFDTVISKYLMEN